MSSSGKEHVLLMRPLDPRDPLQHAAAATATLNNADGGGANSDKFTFLVTIKPSPPTKRRGLPNASSSLSGGAAASKSNGVDYVPHAAAAPTCPPPAADSSAEELEFGRVLQDLMEQLSRPAEQELEEQMRAPHARQPPQPNSGLYARPRQATPPPPSSTGTHQGRSKSREPPRRHHPPSHRLSPSPGRWPLASQTNGFTPDTDELQEKVRRLQADKESLALQVSVLSDQIEAQNEKIRDMEAMLRVRRDRTDHVEERLHTEKSLRTALEAQKVELVREVGDLRHHLAAVDRDKLALTDQLRRAEMELGNNRRRLGDQTGITPNGIAGARQAKIPTPEPCESNRRFVGVWEDAGLRITERSVVDSEIDKMKRALESLMASNEEKDRKIEELRSAMLRYKRVQDKMLQKEMDPEDLCLWTPSTPPMETLQGSTPDSKMTEKPPPGPLRPTATSTPVHGSQKNSASPCSRSKTSLDLVPSGYPEETVSQPAKTPPPRSRTAVDHYGTVPRNYAPSLPSDPRPARPKTPFGKGFLKFRTGCRSSSAPNLAQTEASSTLPPTTVPEATSRPSSRNSKGIKRIFGRLKRSNSHTMESDLSPEEFQRGGIRATAGPRLGWTRELRGVDKEMLDVPFARWDVDKVVSWLHELGLSAYIGECKRWVRCGDQLLKASVTDLEKELGVKNPLHRKKLALALQAAGAETKDEFLLLDYHWVTRWLDDVGLPQYKDAFAEARVDGRVLHYLSVEDLLHLKVTSLLHVISLRQGIRVLRLHHFDPTCLKRRSVPGEKLPPSPDDVALWTNHRVMEWLRSVDLSEYAPNLRGSGVHGALLVLEPRFTAELLATLLSIPPNKTLLRRHLTTHFKELVGPPIMLQKRRLENEPTHVPLTPSVKVKVSKKGQFSLMRKRSKSELDLEDMVCPFNDWRGSAPSSDNSISPSSSPTSSAPVEQEEKRAVQEIGAVSKEIDCLTDMLQNERLLASMATTNV